MSDQEYFTPSGKTLIGTGVTPDVESKPNDNFDLYFTDEVDDAQLEAALNYLNSNK